MMLLKISKDKGDSESCIRYAAREYMAFMGLETEEPVEIRRHKGKPVLENLPFFVSFSHTASMKACAVSDKEVGIDVERMTGGKDFAALSKRFFAGGEITGKRREFYKLWTAKEALKKLTDIPLIDALRLSDYSKVRHFDIIEGISLSVAGEGKFFIVLFF